MKNDDSGKAESRIAIPRPIVIGLTVILLAVGATLFPGTGTTVSAASLSYVINGNGYSNVERAHAYLQNQGYRVYLIIISSRSPGIEGEIYRDLLKRHFRSTTGPDEGFDTHGEFCYPDCVYVPNYAINAISVYGWIGVLKHEYRHITQATNNPEMALDFRSPNGLFTPYGAFSEACADYGLNEAPVYHARYRINRLKAVLSPGQQALIERACSGDITAFDSVSALYNQGLGDSGAFDKLFPWYR